MPATTQEQTHHTESRRRFEQRIDQMDPHVDALHAALEEALTAEAAADSGLRGLNVRLRVGYGPDPEPHRTEEPAADGSHGVECWTARYICGKGRFGYIWCTVEVCDEVEVVVVPG
jgi:hypothetical protein